MTTSMLGVCYYPEHWPETLWRRDAERMVEIGVSQVRIGEFAWSRIEPKPGAFNWTWLDKAVDTLGRAGLQVMLCTPTATPPKWLVDQYPEILPVGADGRTRGFGSRRHYCFSSPVYRTESARITTAVAERYGQHEAVSAWQTDNEYGCHETVRSYSAAAAFAFRDWLREKFEDINALNAAWGTVFWSQEYNSFDAIDLPAGMVTEANPAHLLDFYRFSSDQVVSFNRAQTDILRDLSPGRRIVHNAMGFYFDFDHFELGADLDSIGWDSYPLGFLDLAPLPAEEKARYMRQGHPDFAGFHHDLYRGCGGGNWEILEQQPGPVNWAPHNPAPLPGMAKAWGAEALAHGASHVSYFRWRQAPFAQEQMHAGLLYPDDTPAPAYGEVQALSNDKEVLQSLGAPQKQAALIFSYEANWVFEAEPQGAAWSYIELCMTWYAALRRLGLNVDIVREIDDISIYPLVVCPSLPILSDNAVSALKQARGMTLFGPRTGSKTDHFSIPAQMPPGPLQQLLPLKVMRSESFPPDHRVIGAYNGAQISGRAWLDHVSTDLSPIAATEAGVGLLYEHQNRYYLPTVPDVDFLFALFPKLCAASGLELFPTSADVRIRRFTDKTFAINYGPEPASLSAMGIPEDATFLIGSHVLNPAKYAVWRTP